METTRIPTDSIEIGERHRALSEDAVKRLAASMGEIGLRSPITVRVVDDYVLADGEVCDGVPVLVAGAHRLAAAKQLGWSHIDCIDADDDPITAELWEIAENLHRFDLTTEEKREHIRRYVELLEAKAKVVPQGTLSAATTGRGNKGVIRRAADDLGVSKKVVRGALNPPAKIVPTPAPPLDPEDAYNRWAGQMNRLWGSASHEWRDRWESERDTPVFDNARAA